VIMSPLRGARAYHAAPRGHGVPEFATANQAADGREHGMARDRCVLSFAQSYFVGQTRFRVVQAREPIWTMTRLCPVCGQGSCLVFIACPSCGRLAVRCQEEGSLFLDPRNLEARSTAGAPSAACRGCGAYPVAQFKPASDAAIRSGGFSSSEYA
jgi:hypothetical protein